MQKVDLEYQHIANITPIKNIVICKNKESTEYFLENVYQHFIDCIVVSADKTYPLNPSLNSKVFDALENDSRQTSYDVVCNLHRAVCKP